ncbi:hypothetical protein P0D88_01890 [Paraburkholderia sp. RL18-103-BIB-C]|uniref:alginate O-acetyltransferase AlgX-related protein n=1 Tax=Paraburkholderia sp. RL18-103-BIB-C TaxID=3031637 RepID=UPI0038BDB826
MFGFLGLKPPTLSENRILATRPTMPHTPAEWGSLASRWDAYLTDNFPPRAYIIGNLNYARYLMGYSGSKKIIVGQHGWLFYDDSLHLSTIAGTRRLSGPEISNWVKGFQQRKEYLKGQGAKFYLIIGPTKEDIYPENRPSWMPAHRVDTELDDIFRAAKAAGINTIVDPRTALIEEKHRLPLWDGNESHWTGHGAYIAYSQLLARMHLDMPDVQPFPERHFAGIGKETMGRKSDLAMMLGIDDFTKVSRFTYDAVPTANDLSRIIFLSDRHDWTAPAVHMTGAPGGRTLLLLRDSFATEMIPLLEQNFSRIVIAHTQDGFFRKDLVEKFKPDAVVLEIIEPGLRYTMAPLQ